LGRPDDSSAAEAIQFFAVSLDCVRLYLASLGIGVAMTQGEVTKSTQLTGRACRGPFLFAVVRANKNGRCALTAHQPFGPGGSGLMLPSD
jgi:hypothetical protein